jgi:hypothetical protein
LVPLRETSTNTRSHSGRSRRASTALAALDPDVRAADLRAWKVEYQTQDPAAYPNIATYAHLFPALDDPANFSTLMELLVDSIDARARRHAR